MSTPTIIPGTAGLLYTAIVTKPTSASLLMIDNAVGNPILTALQSADMTRNPAILVAIVFRQDVQTTGLPTVTIGGNVCPAVAAALSPISISVGLSFQAVLALLPFGSGTTFTDGSCLLTLPNGDVYDTDCTFYPVFLYDVDPTANIGFAVGSATAVSAVSPFGTVGPVAAGAGDLAVAIWGSANFGGGGNSPPTITAPTDFVASAKTNYGGGQGDYAIGYGAVPGAGAFNATSTWIGGGVFTNESAIVALIRGSSTACDPDFADVTLLVHMTGANGSTVFTDSSSLANAVTAVGGADIDTSTFQYGTGSLSIDAGSGYFNSSSPPPVNMVGLTSPIVGASANDIITGGGDFTIECWFNYDPAAQAAFQIPLKLFNYGASTYGGLAGFEASVNQTSLDILPMSAWSGISAVISIVAGTWHHFAICRAGAIATMYLDGVNVGTANNWNNAQGAEPSSVTIGCSPFDSGGFGTGWIDEFRITKGLARYTSNFAPPSTLFGGVCTGNIPDVVGDVLATGETAIVAAGFITGTVTYATDLSVPVGDIISQNPGAGPAILGVAVNLVVSLGLPSETVPNIVGDTQAAAEAAITAAVLDVGTVTTAYSVTVPAGDVISQSVPAGTPVLAYTPISFVVSLGPVLSSLQTNLVSDSAVLGGVFGGALNVAEFTYYPMRPCGSGIVSLGTLLLLPGGAPLEMPGGAPVLLQSNDANIVLPEPTVPNMIINRYKQQPGETKIRGIDFTLLCVPGEVIESVEVSSISPQTDPPLVVTQILVDPVTQQIFAYYVGGGVDGTEYLVEFVVTFNSGDVELEEVIFDISILSEAIYP